MHVIVGPISYETNVYLDLELFIRDEMQYGPSIKYVAIIYQG